jgi:hypothetical protein
MSAVRDRQQMQARARFLVAISPISWIDAIAGSGFPAFQPRTAPQAGGRAAAL